MLTTILESWVKWKKKADYNWNQLKEQNYKSQVGGSQGIIVDSTGFKQCNSRQNCSHWLAETKTKWGMSIMSGVDVSYFL